MIKIFLFLSLVAMLQASTTATYSEGVKAFDNKDYKQSYEILSKLYLTNLLDADLNFKLGRSAFELGHYEVALAAFERVEMLEPSNHRNKLEMGRTYYSLEMYQDAQLSLEGVLKDETIPPTVRKNIELFLQKIASSKKRSHTRLSLGLDLFYDTNINYASLDDSFSTVTFGELPSQDEEKGSGVQINVSLSNSYDVGKKDGFIIKNSLGLFAKKHIDDKFSSYDITYYGYNPALMYRGSRYTAELELGIDKIDLDGEDYTSSLSARVNFSFKHLAYLKSMAHIKYIQKSYLQDEQKSQDLSSIGLSYTLQTMFSPKSILLLNTSTTQTKKDSGNRTDIDNDELKLSLRYISQFHKSMGYELSLGVNDKKYKDYSNIFGSKRKDEAKSAGATFNYYVNPTIKLNIKVTYSHNESNQEKYSYKKQFIQTGLSKSF